MGLLGDRRKHQIVPGGSLMALEVIEKYPAELSSWVRFLKPLIQRGNLEV